MSLQIYKPNAKNAGCACSFRFGVDIKNQEPVVFINAIQQHSWDNNNKIGSFSENRNNPDKSLTVKLTKLNVVSLSPHSKIVTIILVIMTLMITKLLLKFPLGTKSVKYRLKIPKLKNMKINLLPYQLLA